MSSAAMKLALTFTAVDAASGIMRMLENRLHGMGSAAQHLQKDFDSMVRNIGDGVKSLSAAWYIGEKLKPGVQIAADMQAQMLQMKMHLEYAGTSASKLHDELVKVREVADSLQKITPFSSQQMVEAETALAKGGIPIQAIVSNGGAASAAAILATIAGLDPQTAAEALIGTAVPWEAGKAPLVNGGRPFEMSTDMVKMADMFQKILTASRLGLNPEGFLSGMSNFAGDAAVMGLSMKDSLAAFAAVSESVRDPAAAGTYLKNFIQRLTGASKQARKEMEQVGLEFWTKQGNLKNWDQIVAELRGKTSKLNQHDFLLALNKIFQMRGIEAALALRRTGTGSYEFEKQRIDTGASWQTKMNIRLEGLGANLQALSGTVKSLTADAFNPMLGPLTTLTREINNGADALRRSAANHQKVMGALDWTAVGAAVAATGYGAFKILKGGSAAMRLIRGLKGGAADTIVGVAEGKALEKAAGVTPVFVTNWPSGPGLGGAGAAEALEEIPAAVMASAALATAAIAGAGLTAIFAAAYFRNPLGRALYGAGEVFHKNGTLDAMKQAAQENAVVAKKVEAFVSRSARQPITLNIHIDENGKITSTSNDMHIIPKINLRRGVFIPRHGKD